MITLHSKMRNFCCALLIGAIGAVLAFYAFMRSGSAFADDETGGASHFVTIYDSGDYRTVKTTAATVEEVLERAEVSVTESDLVEPSLDAVVTGNDYYINIYRARPAVVVDGVKRRYIMTASYDAKQIAREAGFTIYDGDEINLVANDNFLEAGVASTFQIVRNGGRTLTIEEALPFPTQTKYDYSLPKGERHLEQAGEDGRRVSVYEVQFENNIEVSRTLISEEVVLEPVTEIMIVGAELSIRPEQETCAGWLREVGVPENDLEAALYIIYHESHCRIDAENPWSGAYGIPQALPGSKMASAGDDWRTNPLTQLRWMDDYVKNRYGGWQQALQFKQAKGWY